MGIRAEKSIFFVAIEIESEVEREAYLTEACGADLALRRAVEELLVAHERSVSVVDLQVPHFDLAEEWDHAAGDELRDGDGETDAEDDRVGEQIGPYKLLEKLGEGGFGEVYVAEQSSPLKRRVALKLLKAGLASREFIARFEAERQAVALMDHPHIAQVFDAGTTPAGQPFFVMELVRGVPITRFCQYRQLSIRDRLALFADVCDAVQHAHQKGIIHRDLKPSNVLVTLHDTTAVVKVIDFGVAKAINEPLTDKTIYTRFAQMIGTPMYMSPEQAEMNAFDVDTRSDVYSLGVLLYELLTGTTPLEQARLNSLSFDELRRIIREEEPIRPSAQLSTLSPMNSTLSTPRRLELQAEARMLRGELDWIVIKALEKDRRRRYESAADFARDVRRYLDQRPVVARPPSSWYRLRKFAQRNKVMFAATALVVLSLVAGTAVSVWQAIRATQHYNEAEQLRQAAVRSADQLKEANVLLDSARANADEQRWGLALTQYTRATELKPDHYLTWSGRGSLYARLGAWRAAAADFSVALKLGAPANNPGWWGVPQLCFYAGDREAYRLVCAAMRKQVAASDDPPLTMMFARSVLLDPNADRNEAGNLAKRMEQLIERQRFNRNRPGQGPGGGPGGPGGPGHGPGRFGGPDRGPPERQGPGGPPDRQGPGGPPQPGRPPGPPFGGEFGRPMGPPLDLYYYAAGLAHYRAGDYEQALRNLNQAQQSDNRMDHPRLVLPMLALTQQALGNTSAANAALDEAKEALDRWLGDGTLDDLNRMSLPWFDILEFYLEYREAYERLHGKALPPDARLEKLERFVNP